MQIDKTDRKWNQKLINLLQLINNFKRELPGNSAIFV